MKLGANSVLFGGYDMETAFRCIAMSGYDGIEMAAIDAMAQHLVLDRWQELAPKIKQLAQTYELELLAMEQPSRDRDLMEKAMQAAVACGIPIVNCGPGGESGNEESLVQTIDELGELTKMAEKYGITLCVKAHVGASVFDTPTTLRGNGGDQLSQLRDRHGPVPHLPRRRESRGSDRRGDQPGQACSHSRLQGAAAGAGQARVASKRPGRHRPGRLRAGPAREWL